MAELMQVRLKHIQRFVDRTGQARHYLRLPGRKLVPLPGTPGTAEFLAAYQAALAEAVPKPATPRSAPGSLNALAASYYGSTAFSNLRTSSQANYRRIVERLRNAHGDKPVALLEPRNIAALLAERATHPAARNHLLRCLRALMQHAIATGLRTTDPTHGAPRAKLVTKGYRAWTDDEIAAYEAHWPSGSKPRLAMALLLYTGQRRSDVVRMGRQHVARGLLTVRQVKTGAIVTLPINAELAAELAHVPDGQLTFLARDDGRPHTAGGFYNLFVSWCAGAGLEPGLAPHGVRKATARRIAERGGTVHQIMAVTGHRTLSEVAVYTDAADRERLARQGMALVTPLRKRAKK